MVDIPKILYTFWDGADASAIVKDCLGSMWRNFAGYRVVVLSASDVPASVRKAGLSFTQMADYARLDALARTGGVWMDASCFVFDAEWLRAARSSPSIEVIGFGTPFDGDVLESWALAAPASSGMMAAWRDEFSAAIAEGFESYCNRMRAELPGSLVPHLPYLTIHAAAAVARRKRPPGAVHLLPSAPRGPYAVHSLMNWSDTATAMYLLTQPAESVRVLCGSFCKLRGAERLAIEQLLTESSGCIHAGSIFGNNMQLPSRGVSRCVVTMALVLFLLGLIIVWYRLY